MSNPTRQLSQAEALALGRQSRREPTRWLTPFGSWADRIGVPAIVEALSSEPDERFHITSSTFYDYLAGRVAPTPYRAMAIVRISRGAINMREIYEHIEARRRAEREVR